MKMTIILSVSLLLQYVSYGQTFSEWFKQTSTQKKYLKTQIALLQTYLSYLKQGYDIAKSGLSTIHDIKNGEFDLHSLFYSSLKKVNSSIKDWSVLDATISNEAYTHSTATALKSSASGLSDGPREAISATVGRVTDDCDRVMGELKDLVTEGKYSMTDDERLKRLAQLHQYSIAQVAFIRDYRTQASMLALQQRHEQSETSLIESLYGLK